MESVLLTGGMGYIGSHTAVELLREGYDVILVDDLSNSSADVLDRIESITGVPSSIREIVPCFSSPAAYASE